MDMNITSLVRQSEPIDFSKSYDPSHLAGKSVVITGGASGFGAAFAAHWAHHGAHIFIGDLNDSAGEALVAELRQKTKSEHHHYMHCDVRKWEDQVKMFREAAKSSPTGGIDVVVVGAAVADSPFKIIDEPPNDLDTNPNPAPPDLRALNVNLIGAVYTINLASFYLPRNGEGRDRHILLMGSIAGIAPYVVHPGYTASKHALLGLFRALRGRMWTKGVRINLICPYFSKTPIIPVIGRIMCAGGGMGDVDSVLDAATRMTADESIIGRGVIVGPKARVNGELGDEDFEVLGMQEVDEAEEDGPGRVVSTWEIHAHDFEEVEVVVQRYVRLLNTIVAIRGWVGWAGDVWRAIRYGLSGGRWV